MMGNALLEFLGMIRVVADIAVVLSGLEAVG
jgi:hypothetical protein